MRKYLSILSISGLVLGFAGCTSFDQDTAEKEIKSLVQADTGRMLLSGVSLEIDIPPADSVNADSQWVITGISVSTEFESESLEIYFHQEAKGDSMVTVGDSALLLLQRTYHGVLVSTLTPKKGGQASVVTRNFTSQRKQWGQVADVDGWKAATYSLADERSDTNTTQIFSLGIKTGVLDTTIESPASLATENELPTIAKGSTLTLSLRTAGDTSEMVCLAGGRQVVRFLPQQDQAKRWQTEVTLDSSPLVVCIIKKDALGKIDYPADMDIWLIPLHLD
jgi:hypothetical protein